MNINELQKLQEEKKNKFLGKINEVQELIKDEGLDKVIIHLDRIISELQKLGVDVSQISDGFHTFHELYEIRKAYNAALFNEWAKQTEMDRDKNNEIIELVKYDVHKSWKHHDGNLCFGGGWFIVVACLPTGQISNHYHEKDWNLFKIPESEKAKYEFDGHTTGDVIHRLINL